MDHIEAKYRIWIERNQNVMDLFEQFALDALKRGRRFGVQQIAERVRWEVRQTWEASDSFKMNNSHLALIARDLIAKYPALAGLIETRQRRTA